MVRLYECCLFHIPHSLSAAMGSLSHGEIPSDCPADISKALTGPYTSGFTRFLCPDSFQIISFSSKTEGSEQEADSLGGLASGFGVATIDVSPPIHFVAHNIQVFVADSTDQLASMIRNNRRCHVILSSNDQQQTSGAVLVAYFERYLGIPPRLFLPWLTALINQQLREELDGNLIPSQESDVNGTTKDGERQVLPVVSLDDID